MRRLSSIVCLLVLAGVAGAQPKEPTAWERSDKNGKPLVLIYNDYYRYVEGAEVGVVNDKAAPTKVLFRVGNKWYQLPGNSTADLIWDEIQLRKVTVSASSGQAVEALNELNAARVARGLRPYQRDDGLTIAAMACAVHRAERGIAGHSSNDFGFLPPGSDASAAGCAAWEPSWGWGSCCAYENWTWAGAAWAMGRDGRRYMHLYVK